MLGEIPGIGTYREILDRTIEVPFRHLQVRVLDLDTLIAAKRYAGRQKDHPIVRELEIIRQMLQQRQRDEERCE